MAKIAAKQTFTMRQGEIRISWKPEFNGERETDLVNDEDVLGFIQKDSVYSKKEKWREVFDIIEFEKASNNEKYSHFLKKNISNLSLSNFETGKALEKDNGKLDARGKYAGYDRRKIINEFLILNDGQKNDALSYFKNTEDIAALVEIKDFLSSRGDKRWASDVENILKSVEMKKASKAGQIALNQINKTS